MRRTNPRNAAALLSLTLFLGCGGASDSQSTEGMDDAATAYAEGLEALSRRAGRTDTDAAVAAFERAIAADAEHAAAWAGLAQSRMWLQQNFGVAGQLAEATEAAQRAAELAPNAVETHLALGYIDYWGHGNLDGALGHFQAAQGLAPEDADVAGAIGNIYRRQGRLDEAIAAYERRLEIAPDHGQGLVTLAGTYLAVGRYGDAREVGDRLLALDDGRGHVWRFWGSFHAGDTASAWVEIPGIQEAQGRAGQPGYFAFLQALSRDDAAGADALIEEIGTDGLGTGLRDLMATHLWATDQTGAFSDAFDGWIGELADGLVDDPADERQRLAQAARLSDMAFLEAARGNGQVSMGHAAAVVELDPMSMDVWAGSNSIADVTYAHMALGHVNPALSGLEELTAESQGPSTTWIELFPIFDDLRGNDRMEALIEERRSIEQPAS